MSAPQRARLADGRWHFQHGPIDCILGAEGDAQAIARAVHAAWQRFDGLLAELVSELPALRTDLSAMPVTVHGPVARRMVEACRVHTEGGCFITAMAAVAGSVADELITCFDDPRITRAHVNNGGDIALHLSPGTHFDVGLVGNVDAPGLDGRARIDGGSGIRGIATSGWRGRSFSLGIADSVTVLAATAAQADAAATVIANVVNLDDPRIRRAPANAVRDDSDLGSRLVTTHVPSLPQALIAAALAAGLAQAEHEIACGRIVAAALGLQGHWRQAGRLQPFSQPSRQTLSSRPTPSWSLAPCSIPRPPNFPPSMSASLSSMSRTSGTMAARAPSSPCSAAA